MLLVQLWEFWFEPLHVVDDRGVGQFEAKNCQDFSLGFDHLFSVDGPFIKFRGIDLLIFHGDEEGSLAIISDFLSLFFCAGRVLQKTIQVLHSQMNRIAFKLEFFSNLKHILDVLFSILRADDWMIAEVLRANSVFVFLLIEILEDIFFVLFLDDPPRRSCTVVIETIFTTASPTFFFFVVGKVFFIEADSRLGIFFLHFGFFVPEVALGDFRDFLRLGFFVGGRDE